MRPLRIGFIPLVDSAPLVVAHAVGFAREEGLSLELVREASWATLRDKLAIGVIDAAHLLAPIAVASKIGVGNPKPPFAAIMSLSMNGNAISLSRALFDEMRGHAPHVDRHDILAKARALAAVIAAREKRGAPRLTFAIVHPISPHNYELRYVLGAAGIDPDSDIDLVVVPPPYVVDHVRDGLIDGFCVGAPWTSLGVAENLVRVMAVKPQIWSFSPEKVLGVREGFLDDNEEVAHRLIRATTRAAAWCDDPQNRATLSTLLAAPEFLGVAAGLVEDVLAGLVPIDDGAPETIDDYIVFDRDGAGFPWRSHALWFYSQMVRWGQTTHSPERERLAAEAYRPDLYRAALMDFGVPLPASDAKIEGTSQGVQSRSAGAARSRNSFFDGRVFDPSKVSAYIAGFDVRAKADLEPG